MSSQQLIGSPAIQNVEVVVQTDVDYECDNGCNIVDATTAVTVKLPLNPGPGRLVTILASGGAVTVNGNGRTVAGTGTVTLGSAISYIYSIGLNQWIPSGSSGGAVPASIVKEIRFAVGLVTVSSVTSIPANAIVVYAALNITTPYSVGTITIGRTGATTLLLIGPSSAVATSAGLYSQDQDTAWGAASLPVLVTVTGGPVSGASFAIVRYVTTPDV